MTEKTFLHEMQRAEAHRTIIDVAHAEYWCGFTRGLRRAHHGERFGTAGEHAQWLSAADDPDDTRRQRGLGYRDGMAVDSDQPERDREIAAAAWRTRARAERPQQAVPGNGARPVK